MYVLADQTYFFFKHSMGRGISYHQTRESVFVLHSFFFEILHSGLAAYGPFMAKYGVVLLPAIGAMAVGLIVVYVVP